jgi:hypothetical protein
MSLYAEICSYFEQGYIRLALLRQTQASRIGLHNTQLDPGAAQLNGPKACQDRTIPLLKQAASNYIGRSAGDTL